jgi:hypothetical protein
MPSTKVDYTYENGPSSHAVLMEDGSIYYLHFTRHGVTVSYAPDDRHYPKMVRRNGWVERDFEPIPNYGY